MLDSVGHVTNQIEHEFTSTLVTDLFVNRVESSKVKPDKGEKLLRALQGTARGPFFDLAFIRVAQL